ncbi:hypothetical protein [Sinorhizobium fredii]|uniref:hypothetical protein n=1 Tax=Rhizobium fredii TaxID=380 RepID=UPI00138B1618|nr:hypothetical protein [Sinorhizobium fredii]
MAIADALSTDEVRVIFGECHVDVLDLVWIIRWPEPHRRWKIYVSFYSFTRHRASRSARTSSIIKLMRF